jgi:conjugative transfer region lipoprotein (TIGR03751 family)
MRIVKLIMITSISCLFGCAAPHFSKLPEGGATMSDIYNQKTKSPMVDEYKLMKEALRQTTFSETKTNTGEQEFIKLPNPELGMYVYPHFVLDEQLPIAGYTTHFPLFNKEHYVLEREMG